MSTDTDRVVNFAPSFHQFWSLPFQIAVSLYLLHQQVNLSFIQLIFLTLIKLQIIVIDFDKFACSCLTTCIILDDLDQDQWSRSLR